MYKRQDREKSQGHAKPKFQFLQGEADEENGDVQHDCRKGKLTIALIGQDRQSDHQNHEEQVDRQSDQQFIEVVVKDRDFKKFQGLRWFLVTYKGVDPGMAVQILTIENLGGVSSRCF